MYTRMYHMPASEDTSSMYHLRNSEGGFNVMFPAICKARQTHRMQLYNSTDFSSAYSQFSDPTTFPSHSLSIPFSFTTGKEQRDYFQMVNREVIKNSKAQQKQHQHHHRGVHGRMLNKCIMHSNHLHATTTSFLPISRSTSVYICKVAKKTSACICRAASVSIFILSSPLIIRSTNYIPISSGSLS